MHSFAGNFSYFEKEKFTHIFINWATDSFAIFFMWYMISAVVSIQIWQHSILSFSWILHRPTMDSDDENDHDELYDDGMSAAVNDGKSSQKILIHLIPPFWWIPSPSCEKHSRFESSGGIKNRSDFCKILSSLSHHLLTSSGIVAHDRATSFPRCPHGTRACHRQDRDELLLTFSGSCEHLWLNGQKAIVSVMCHQ